MRLGILQLVALGLLVSGLEGAADAVRVVDHGSAPHDMHHPHHGDEDNDAGESGAGGDGHACHCTAHFPPLAFRLALAVLVAERERQQLDPLFEPYLGGPPPLPPPIV